MSFVRNEHVEDGLALRPVVHAAITTAATACHGYGQIAGISDLQLSNPNG